MKKLLSILAAVGLTATASSSVVACGVTVKTLNLTVAKDKLDDGWMDENVRKGFDYAKKNQDIATKIAKDALKEKKMKETDNEVDLVSQAKTLQDEAKDMWLVVYSHNQDVTTKDTKGKDVTNKQDVYQLASAHEFLDNVKTKTSDLLTARFIKVADFLTFINTTENIKILTSKDAGTAGATIKALLADKDHTGNLSVADIIRISRKSSSAEWDGDGAYQETYKTVASALMPNGNGTYADGQKLLGKIFKGGDPEVRMNITITDAAQKQSAYVIPDMDKYIK